MVHGKKTWRENCCLYSYTEAPTFRMYMQQAQTLEHNGKLKEAERLYLTVKRVDRAMTMYKNQRQYREMARLVRAHKPELLEQTLIRIAQELECEGNLRQAEQYYMEVPTFVLHAGLEFLE